jgi:hypothetical protein
LLRTPAALAARLAEGAGARTALGSCARRKSLRHTAADGAP